MVPLSLWSKRKKEKEHNVNQYQTNVLLANPTPNLLTHAIVIYLPSTNYAL